MSERQSVRKPTAAAKFEAEDASACLSWMEQVLGPLGVSCTVKSQEEFQAVLKDGTLLCELMNTLSPGSVKNINRSQIAFKQRENIEVYLEAAHQYGQKKADAYK